MARRLSNYELFFLLPYQNNPFENEIFQTLSLADVVLATQVSWA
jgi:hypothetical protein